MKTAILILVMMLCSGCSLLTGPKETKKFRLEPSGGYRGKPVGNCSNRSADDFSCGSVHVTGGFFGSFDQNVMYTVTCYRD